MALGSRNGSKALLATRLPSYATDCSTVVATAVVTAHNSSVEVQKVGDGATADRAGPIVAAVT